MMLERKRRPARGGAVQLGGERHLDTLCAHRAQFLIAEHHIRPELAAMVAALAFKGGRQ